MFFLRTFLLGLKSLLLHPMRSLLTIVGIFFGVASVIWLLAIGEGISRELQRQIEELGADNIIVRSVKPPAELSAGMTGPVPYGLKRDEFERLITTIPTISSALPIREVRRNFTFGDRDVDGRLVGCTPEYAEVTRLTIERGRFLSDADVDGKKNFCVLSYGVAETLFPYEDPIGRRIYLGESKDYYQVVGILKFRNASAAIGGSLEAQDFASDVYIPISTLRQRIGDTIVTRRGSQFSAETVELNQITIRVQKKEDMRKTAEVVRKTADLVRQMLGVREESSDPVKLKAMPAAMGSAGGFGQARRDVAVIVPEELLEQSRIMGMILTFFMGLIAAISLLVGGIGIMNIMLATVTERTREIGIRRALGATRSHIITQFLVETITLSSIGGLTGILAGLLGPVAVTVGRDLLYEYAPRIMSTLPDTVKRIEPAIVWASIPLAFGISVTVGVVFGIYPAFRAARMDPIEALRHE
jgi:putative ABC transport system permease protein